MNCDNLITIPQFSNNCWFNAFLTSAFYSTNIRKYVLEASKNWEKDDEIFKAAEVLAEDLEEKKIRVMLDDRRDASPGVKFKDAELIGIPYILIVGKGLSEGKIELKIRKSGEKREIPLISAISEVEKVVLSS